MLTVTSWRIRETDIGFGADENLKRKTAEETFPPPHTNNNWDPGLFLDAQNRILGSLGHAKLDHALGGDLDGFASRRITAHARFAVDQNELAQPGKGEAVLGVFIGQVYKRFECERGLLFGETCRFSNGTDDL
jgi:hypothetical protein